jgi:hypothetical protein
MVIEGAWVVEIQLLRTTSDYARPTVDGWPFPHGVTAR